MPSQKNLSVVEQLENKLAQAKAVILADYRGLSVSDIQKLRSQVRQAGGSLTVAKNTLIKIALEKHQPGLPRGVEDALRGPTALLLSLQDEISPIKALVDFAKNHALQIPIPKAGLLDDKVLTAADIATLASLPSKPELIARLLHQLQAPVYGLVNVLHANLRQLVYALNAVKSQKEVN